MYSPYTGNAVPSFAWINTSCGGDPIWIIQYDHKILDIGHVQIRKIQDLGNYFTDLFLENVLDSRLKTKIAYLIKYVFCKTSKRCWNYFYFLSKFSWFFKLIRGLCAAWESNVNKLAKNPPVAIKPCCRRPQQRRSLPSRHLYPAVI